MTHLRISTDTPDSRYATITVEGGSYNRRRAFAHVIAAVLMLDGFGAGADITVLMPDDDAAELPIDCCDWLTASQCRRSLARALRHALAVWRTMRRSTEYGVRTWDSRHVRRAA